MTFLVLKKWYLVFFIVSFLILGITPIFTHPVEAALNNRSLTLSTSAAAVGNVRYDLQFDIAGGLTLGSIAVQFCQEGPVPNEPCTNQQVLMLGGFINCSKRRNWLYH